ncbi:hypothetical protein CSIM01_09261 [Colletotrichum simmondsii]|uniref:Uncharacterized protein n=1 Tax=Colletotrichum simmondsii TaxID=703756 RepID=A0A135RPU9_9PEZI|nr:hypothetical protein CSIM01_09261 [Colletotrichum simmondsii]
MGTDTQSPSMSARYVGIQNPDLADYPCEAGHISFDGRTVCNTESHTPPRNVSATWRHLSKSALSHRKVSGERIYIHQSQAEIISSASEHLKVCMRFTSSRAEYALRVHLKNEDAAMARLAGQALRSKNPSLP